MSHSSDNVSLPASQYGADYPKTIKSMLERGQDPKEMVIELCKPLCKHWEDKLHRCEATLKAMKSSDPEKSCMYPLRDLVTCIEGCVRLLLLKLAD